MKIFLYSSFVFSCHLFLISSASVRSRPFVSFIEPIFAWNVPLVSLISSFSLCELKATPSCYPLSSDSPSPLMNLLLVFLFALPTVCVYFVNVFVYSCSVHLLHSTLHSVKRELLLSFLPLHPSAWNTGIPPKNVHNGCDRRPKVTCNPGRGGKTRQNVHVPLENCKWNCLMVFKRNWKKVAEVTYCMGVSGVLLERQEEKSQRISVTT